MKKIITVVLCIAMILSLAACGKNEGENNSSDIGAETVHIRSDLKEGKIPELPLVLGCDISQATKTLNDLEKLPEGAEPEEGYTYYDAKYRGDTVRLSCEGNLYYYNQSKSESGISAMVTFSDAFGFSIGIDMLSDITSAISQDGTVYSPTADELYFTFGEPDLSKYQAIYYTEGKNRLDFIFYDSYLSAVLIWNTELWDSKDA